MVLDDPLPVYAGMTVEDLQADVRIWFRDRSPSVSQAAVRSLYVFTQLELIQYLRTKGFKNDIVTGGGVEFFRAVGERPYGIPPERVIGSSTQMELELTFRACGAELVSMKRDWNRVFR